MCLLHLCGIGGSVDHICTTWKKSVMMIYWFASHPGHSIMCKILTSDRVHENDSDVVGKMKHQIGR